MTLHDPTLVNACIGGLGGIVGLIVRERGCIYLPRVRDHRLYLNSLSGIILGAIAGIVGDHDWLNCLMWGAAGTTIVSGLVESFERKSATTLGANCEKRNLK